MAKAVKSAIKWVGGVVGGGVSALFGVVGKPILRALTPKVPEIDTSRVTDFQANPDAGVPYAIGITGTAGTYVYATVGEAKNRNILFNTILSGGGPIDGFVGFEAEGTSVVFDGPDTPNSGPYRHLMWMRTQRGDAPSAALLPPNTLDAGVLAEWTPAHKQSGYAVAWYVCGADQKVYSNGVPKPIWKIRGVRVYDWRLDSTYPGGFGPQRVNDPTTWSFSENPAVHAVAWCLGRYQNGRRVLGLGCFLSQLVMAKFNEWANICDANGWKVGGVVYSTDTKWQILKAICQAGGGYPIPLGAKISVIFNAPRVSIATLTGADIDGNPSIVGTQLRRDRFNRAIPRYRSEANGWQMVPAAALEIAEFVAQDGNIPRTKELEWPLVQDVDQATQLAAYGICNSREIGPIELPLIPPWMGLEPGDCITLNEPEFGLVNQKLVIVGRSRDLSSGERSITCVTETDSKHPFCLGRTGTPPPLPSLSAIDTLPSAPDPGSWVVVGGTLPGPGGSLPAIIITGAVDDPNAIEIVIEFRPVGSTGEWSTTSRPISATRIEITEGVAPGVTYDVRLRYRYARNTEDASTNLVLPPVLAGRVDAGAVGGYSAAGVIDGMITQALTIAAEALRQGTWRIENDEIVKIPGGGTLRMLQEQLGITVDGIKTFVDFQRSVDSNGNAMWALTAQNDTGKLTGIKNLLTGEGLGKLQMAADVLEIVDPDGGNPRYILRYGLDNRLILDNVYIALLEVGAVKSANIDLRQVTESQVWEASYAGERGVNLGAGSEGVWAHFGLAGAKATVAYADLPTGTEVNLRMFINGQQQAGDDDTISWRLKQIDPDGVVTYNPRILRSSLVGKPQVICWEWRQIISADGPYTFQLEYYRNDGEGIFYECQLTADAGKR